MNNKLNMINFQESLHTSTYTVYIYVYLTGFEA